jgi:hypothetical protein
MTEKQIRRPRGGLGMTTYLFFLAQPAGVFGPGVSVAGGHRGGIAAANLAALLTCDLATNLQFEAVYAGKHLRVQLLDESRIAREATRIDGLHLADQALDIAQSGGLIAIGLAQIVELAHGVLIEPLHLGLRERLRLTARVAFGENLAAGVHATVVIAPAPPAAVHATVPIATADAVAASVGAALLAAILAATLLPHAGLLPLATLLALTSLLTLAAGLLAALALALLLALPLLALAALAVAITHAAVDGLEIFAQTLDAIEGLLATRSLALLVADSRLGLTDLIVEASKAFGDARFDGAGEGTCSLTDPASASLEHALEIGVFDAG